MDFDFSSEQMMVREMVSSFRLKEVEPLAELIEVKKDIPSELLQKVNDLNMLGIGYPSEYGGVEGDTVTKMIIKEELSRSCPSLAAVLSVSDSASHALMEVGTEEQKQKYLPKLFNGESFGSFAFTEANTGSDPRVITTTAVEKGDGFVINGMKMFISNAVLDGPIILFVKDKSRENKITAIVVEKKTKGITVRTPINKMGMNGLHSSEVIVEDLHVTSDNILGGVEKRGKGFSFLRKLIAGSRLATGAESLGIAEEALNLAVQYVKVREVNGRPMSKLGTVQSMVAEMSLMVEAARWVLYRTAFLADQGKDIIAESAKSKLLSARAGVKVTSMSMQLHGAYGYSKEYKIERLYRDAKIAEIYKGSAELNKIVLGSSILA
jgi:alkylation response protein AidB-like acyl-CoA dehydrogenase